MQPIPEQSVHQNKMSAFQRFRIGGNFNNIANLVTELLSVWLVNRDIVLPPPSESYTWNLGHFLLGSILKVNHRFNSSSHYTVTLQYTYKR